MNGEPDPGDVETALDWAVRTSDPAFDDWQDFSAWLDGCPSRNRLYDAVMIEAGFASEAAAPRGADRSAIAGVVSPGASRRRPRRRWLAQGRARRAGWLVPTGAVGVAAAAMILVQPGAVVPPQPLLVETAANQGRRILLEDGSRIDVAGGSRLSVSPGGSREVAVDRGRAVFVVRHDDDHPFIVRAGGYELVDAGTVFEVVRTADRVRVSVAEGAVVVDPAGTPLTLSPGDRAELDRATGDRTVVRVPAEQVGNWRQSSLTYRDRPLADVADDLSGALGVRLTVAPELASRRFTGTLIPGSLVGHPERVGALLDVAVRPGPDGWDLQPL